MKKVFPVLALLLLLFLQPVRAETGAQEKKPAEWTVLFYLCGADLESKYGYASEDIRDISACEYPQDLVSVLYGGADSSEIENIPEINVVIQTGGSGKWHEETSGVSISSSVLQRWHYECDRDARGENQIRLDQELPLQSMADPGTLTDFIRWGVRSYPAKKYALVLWGHGDGAKTGILMDELFDNEVMQLDELRKAMSDSGTHFEAVLLEACLSANLETAYVIHDFASWMIASEEVLPGEGTPTREWLQELFYNAEQDGKTLGRNICDMTQLYYARSENRQASATLTMSVIDLSKIGAVMEKIDNFFTMLSDAYKNQSITILQYVNCLNNAPEYGDGEQNMIDLAGIFYGLKSFYSADLTMRNDMISALNEAIVHCVRGSGRSASRGLSFCFPTDFTPRELETYSHNCISPFYLSFLDAVTPWTAPEQIYADGEEPLPRMDTLEEYQIRLEKTMTPQNIPGFLIRSVGACAGVNYSLYRLDPKTNLPVRLGRTPSRIFIRDLNTIMFCAVEPWLWPSIDGELCDIELISTNGTEALYSVPVQIGPDVWYFRYGRTYDGVLTDRPEDGSLTHPSTYTMYGLWEGYDDDSGRLSRNVKSLSQMAGQEYRLLYPAGDGEKTGKAKYTMGRANTLYRSMRIESSVLPAGTYYLEYEVLDLFMRPIKVERIEFYWDGKNVSYPEDFTWKGMLTLKWEGI